MLEMRWKKNGRNLCLNWIWWISKSWCRFWLVHVFIFMNLWLLCELVEFRELRSSMLGNKVCYQKFPSPNIKREISDDCVDGCMLELNYKTNCTLFSCFFFLTWFSFHLAFNLNFALAFLFYEWFLIIFGLKLKLT